MIHDLKSSIPIKKYRKIYAKKEIQLTFIKKI